MPEEQIIKRKIMIKLQAIEAMTAQIRETLDNVSLIGKQIRELANQLEAAGK
jgi:hypothetical protein